MPADTPTPPKRPTYVVIKIDDDAEGERDLQELEEMLTETSFRYAKTTKGESPLWTVK